MGREFVGLLGALVAFVASLGNRSRSSAVMGRFTADQSAPAGAGPASAAHPAAFTVQTWSPWQVQDHAASLAPAQGLSPALETVTSAAADESSPAAIDEESPAVADAGGAAAVDEASAGVEEAAAVGVAAATADGEPVAASESSAEAAMLAEAPAMADVVAQLAQAAAAAEAAAAAAYPVAAGGQPAAQRAIAEPAGAVPPPAGHAAQEQTHAAAGTEAETAPAIITLLHQIQQACSGILKRLDREEAVRRSRAAVHGPPSPGTYPFGSVRPPEADPAPAEPQTAVPPYPAPPWRQPGGVNAPAMSLEDVKGAVRRRLQRGAQAEAEAASPSPVQAEVVNQRPAMRSAQVQAPGAQGRTAKATAPAARLVGVYVSPNSGNHVSMGEPVLRYGGGPLANPVTGAEDAGDEAGPAHRDETGEGS